MLKKWYEVFAANDCLEDHVTWNDMIDYIKHSACLDFTIHSTCTSTGEAFKFTANSIAIEGDRAIYINDDNTFVGHGAGDNIGAGTGNTLIGHDAGQANNFSSCVFLGYEAGKSNTQNNIIGIGYGALLNNTGINNTAVGHGSINGACTGANNTAFGFTSLQFVLGGAGNTAIGASALRDTTTGSFNTSVGDSASYNNETGERNVTIGYNAGTTQTNISNCVYIGQQTGISNTISNRLFINNTNSLFPLIYGEFDNDAVKFGDNSAAWNIQFIQSRIHMLETTTPGAIANYGAIYCKADNKLYFQDGAGAEHEVAFV